MSADRTTSKGQLRLIVIIVLGVLAVVLALQNREIVDTRILFFTASMPRFALLLLTLAVGFVAGFLAGTMRRRRE
ncbi:MAG: LapA family protein [Candidatus Brocadiia bacterium]